MSRPSVFAGFTETPWLPPNDSHNPISLENLNTADSLYVIASQQPTPSSEERDDVEANQDLGNSRRTRKRPLYSHKKCSYCRERRLKCEPETRQWPEEKCDPCEKSGLPCSPVQDLQEYKRQKSQPTSVQRTEDIEIKTSAEELPNDLWASLHWWEMLGNIRSIAKNTDKLLSKTAYRRRPEIGRFIGELELAESFAFLLLEHQIDEILDQTAVIGIDKLHKLYQGIAQSRYGIAKFTLLSKIDRGRGGGQL
ncbi:hypothetical protein GGR58DRAFT_520108 [Xylaria digitata]|nr:hypothetical protein GGR58DRAFT_520108 [Xylaria digitata]